MRATHIAQHINIAAARFAKGEVFARDNSRNPKPFNEQFDDEIFGAGRRKFSIKIICEGWTLFLRRMAASNSGLIWDTTA